ncbi:hypothetical protein HUG15_20745 [Salicibibacter cibarius]|uniref:Uncharacterized protein n=1 Tax=Salicibibacter cibarius TaxID=2743000 RepID=A0A7T6Z6M0_9BACI|nr:hypothetical protein [Salicibibacter cibarius]QQK77766.1 hypothetical protein HUG15_20745 [Salicibibacter cibarius]
MDKIAQGNGWEHLINEGLIEIVDFLVNGHEIWLIDREVNLGEMVLKNIRDELLNQLLFGDIKYNNYVDSLSRLYLYSEPPKIDRSSFIFAPIIVYLSFNWYIEMGIPTRC